MIDKKINATLIELENSQKKQKKKMRDTKEVKELLLNKSSPSLEKGILPSLETPKQTGGLGSLIDNKKMLIEDPEFSS